jgi:Cft2 family RNA processing exonuclease
MDHMGSLPMVFGRLGLGGVPVICTTPVSKFGKMILYDFCLNKGMEGSLASSTPESQQQFELDDIDLALSNVTKVKYSQTIHLPGIAETAGKGKGSHQFVLSVVYLFRVELLFPFSHNMEYDASS